MENFKKATSITAEEMAKVGKALNAVAEKATDAAKGLGLAITTQTAIKNVESLGKAKIVREFMGYIIMAQDEQDFLNKILAIRRNETDGFYTIQSALLIK